MFSSDYRNCQKFSASEKKAENGQPVFKLVIGAMTQVSPDPSGKYQWILKSVMVVVWNRNKSQTRYSYKIYDYTSRSLPLDDWMQNDGEMLNQGLDDSVEGMAEQMANDIRFKD